MLPKWRKKLIIQYNKWESREDWDRSYYFNFFKKKVFLFNLFVLLIILS